ncbi:uncharacterized protein N0V89_010197 [Didymosphaeria variabile]|uniref:Uncharacterized protein n=1 Tax=Didymosphaeria variabile TaxID=1932322 RepID=A0A9W8XGL0_9PLEO|nr:uncharacterized protein N0V89_010197 [Didymosphaeria variabile]KAJ4348819.1 hypothetical protein N0V89_010197 [Didymosphaeria variabile]
MAPNPPFLKQHALDQQVLALSGGPNQAATIHHVPDQPSVPLNKQEVRLFLDAELKTAILDKMYNWLWVCATKESHRIDALHQQVFKGRSIVPTEDPALHLVWFKDKVCIKPMPLCLLNHDFWLHFLPDAQDPKDAPHFDTRVALGFLRSYAHLIRHRSDLALAVEKGLLPKHVEWLQWEHFISPFRNVQDCDVAPRYHFGQFRLTRLNLLIRVLRPRSHDDAGTNRHYYTMHWHTAAYLRQFVEAGVFVFASVSLIMSAMQVILSLPSEVQTRTWVRQSAALSFAFWGFCITVLILLAVSWMLLLAGPVLYFAAQQVFGYAKKEKFDRDMNRVGRSGVGEKRV